MSMKNVLSVLYYSRSDSKAFFVYQDSEYYKVFVPTEIEVLIANTFPSSLNLSTGRGAKSH